MVIHHQTQGLKQSTLFFECLCFVFISASSDLIAIKTIVY